MTLEPRQVSLITGGAWLIGIGLLYWTASWWPGIMFLIGVTVLLQTLARDSQRWALIQGALWMFGIGVVALLNFNVVAIFILLGLGLVVAAFIRPSIGLGKPHVDKSLE